MTDSSEVPAPCVDILPLSSAFALSFRYLLMPRARIWASIAICSPIPNSYTSLVQLCPPLCSPQGEVRVGRWKSSCLLPDCCVHIYGNPFPRGIGLSYRRDLVISQLLPLQPSPGGTGNTSQCLPEGVGHTGQSSLATASASCSTGYSLPYRPVVMLPLACPSSSLMRASATPLCFSCVATVWRRE